MILTQLQVEELFRWNGKSVSKYLHSLRTRNKRFVTTMVRSSRRACISWYRRQYFVTTAYNDLGTSVRRNEDIFIAVSILGATLGYAYTTIAANLTYAFFMTAFLYAEFSGVSMFVVSLVAAASLAVIPLWIAAFLLNAQSVAIMNGANRRNNRSVRTTIKQSYKNVGRTTMSWVLLALAAAIPASIIGAIGLVHSVMFMKSQEEVLAMLPYYAVAAAVCASVVLLQFALVPFVALFEQDLSVKDVFKRSNTLLHRKGKMFLLGLYSIFALVLAGEFMLATGLHNLFSFNRNLVFGLMAVVTTIFLHGIMTVFYRKRRLARS